MTGEIRFTVDLSEVLAKLEEIKTLMTQQFTNLNESLDAAGTSLEEIAEDLGAAIAEITALKEQLAAGLTPEETTAVQARIDTLVASLQSAADIIDPAVPPA